MSRVENKSEGAKNIYIRPLSLCVYVTKLPKAHYAGKSLLKFFFFLHVNEDVEATRRGGD